MVTSTGVFFIEQIFHERDQYSCHKENQENTSDQQRYD